MSEYFVTKMFSPGKGVSCTFRNWRAGSHCNRDHGYDLMFQVTFACAPEYLTKEGWVVDFGALKPLEQRIKDTFDHRTIVAEDDPALEWYKEGERLGVKALTIMPRIGAEAFSLWLGIEATTCLQEIGRLGPVRVRSASVFEHQANMAGYQP